MTKEKIDELIEYFETYGDEQFSGTSEKANEMIAALGGSFEVKPDTHAPMVYMYISTLVIRKIMEVVE